jgi:AcrR family transcriptional regulator
MMKRKHTSRTRESILAAAEKCFAASGYAGTSINKLAASTRYTKPVLYYHFGSKAGLFNALLEQAYDECFAIVGAAAEKSATLEDQLVNILAEMFDFLRDRRDITRLAFAAAFAAPKEMPKALKHDDRRRRNFQFMQKLIQAGVDRGELNPAFSVHALTCGIYGALSFYLMASVIFPGTKLNRKTAAEVVALYLNGAKKR